MLGNDVSLPDVSAVESERRSLFPTMDLSRRGFVITSLAAGFAAAVQPVSAATITTDAQGLDVGEVKIPVADGSIPAYRAMPATGGPFPTILVVQEVFGVHEYIKDVCRRFAKLGYFAVAPALYAREGDTVQLSDFPAIMAVVAKVPDAQVMTDLDSTVAWAKSTGKADTTRLGINGFCWGGRIAWLYDAHNPQLKAAVAWYGRPSGDKSSLAPKNPIDLVDEMKAPILAMYGGADAGIPVTDVEAMRKAMAAAGKKDEIIVFPDTPHGFHADYRPSYRPGPAQEGWAKALAWFKANGIA